MKLCTGISVIAAVITLCLLGSSPARSQGESARSIGQGGHAGRMARSAVHAIPASFKSATVNPLPAGTYTIGAGGTFETIDSAFSRLSVDGILGPVTLLLTDTLYEVPIPDKANVLPSRSHLRVRSRQPHYDPAGRQRPCDHPGQWGRSALVRRRELSDD